MSMPHTCRCGVCGREMSELFPRTPIIPTFGGAAPAPANEFGVFAERLRSFSGAYPEDIFGPVTAEETKEHASLLTRNSAAMGRHCAKIMAEAAAEIERLRAENDALQAALKKIVEVVRLDNLIDCTDLAWIAHTALAAGERK